MSGLSLSSEKDSSDKESEDEEAEFMVEDTTEDVGGKSDNEDKEFELADEEERDNSISSNR